MNTTKKPHHLSLLALHVAVFATAMGLFPVPPARAQSSDYRASESLAAFAQLVSTPAISAKIAAMLDVQSQVSKASVSLQDLRNSARKLGLALEGKRLTLQELRQRGGPAILRLKNPDEFATLFAIGPHHALVFNHVVDNEMLATRYAGESLTLAGAGPSLVADNPVRVVKVTATGSEIASQIIMTNRGRQPLSLEVAETSCGCTQAELSSKTLGTNQSATLTVKMKAEGWGEKTETATIRTSDPLWPRVVVALQAQMPKSVVPTAFFRTVVLPCRGLACQARCATRTQRLGTPSPYKFAPDNPSERCSNPQRLVINTTEGRTESRKLTLLLPANSSVDKVSGRQSFVTAKLLGFEPIEGGLIQSVEVSIAANAPVGAFTDELTFQLNGAEVPRIGVPIEGTVESDITLNPRQLFLGQVGNDSNVLKTVIVQSRSERPFSIKSVESKNPHITAKASPDIVAAAHAVEVNIAVSGQAGSVMEDILKLTLADGRTLDIPVLGLIAKANETATALTSQASPKLQVGKPAPDFTALDMNGNTLRLSDWRGKKNLLLTFFPKCFTGGCAGQLASLQAERKSFAASDTEVVAVSVDPAADQVAFAAKLGLDFPLIPDTERKLCLLYDAAQQPADLAARMSVLIDKAGIVRLIDRDVQVKTHGADLLAQMRALGMAK